MKKKGYYEYIPQIYPRRLWVMYNTSEEEIDKCFTDMKGKPLVHNDEICSCVNDYIESLPYKAGDKVSCRRCDVCWIASIVPEKYRNHFTGDIEVRINPAKKDGTRSNREFVLYYGEIDSIKKIN